MPRYDFRCLKGHVFEREFKFGEAPKDMLCEVEFDERGQSVCSALAVRQFNIPMAMINNKVMLPPSQRVKNFTLEGR